MRGCEPRTGAGWLRGPNAGAGEGEDLPGKAADSRPADTGEVGDGALGTELQRRGLPPGEPPERWNWVRPDQVRAVSAAYAGLGVDWLRTNTFGANRPRLALHGLEASVERANREGVRLAREAGAGRPVAVLGSVGPTGSAAAAEWRAAYQEQFEYLAAAGVDGVVVETVVRSAEGRDAVELAVRQGLGRVLAAYTPGPGGRLLDGSDPERFARECLEAGAAAVGVNCGAGPESLLGPIAQLAAVGVGPLYVAPSAGIPVLSEGVFQYPVGPDGFQKAAIQFRERGVRILAGCCGAGPGHLAAVLERFRRPKSGPDGG
ncbi:MAG: hypothetical protein FJX77_00890 [Armatimonadetes bacterium]|nr:hypothetical protein [Armatimonadota bacterium]